MKLDSLRKKILGELNRSSKPMPVGALAIRVGVTISRLAEELPYLTLQGYIRQAQFPEVESGVVAYVSEVRDVSLIYDGPIPEERKTTRMAKIIGIDYDGVLGDFHTPLLEVYREECGIDLKVEDIKTWDLFGILTPEQKKRVFEVIESPGWCASIPLYPEAKKAVKELERMGHTLICVTAPWDSATWESERRRAIKNDFPSMAIIATHSKEYVATDVLIEDKPSNLEKWVDMRGGVGYLIAHPYNETYPKHKMQRVTWDKILRDLETGFPPSLPRPKGLGLSLGSSFAQGS